MMNLKQDGVLNTFKFILVLLWLSSMKAADLKYSPNFCFSSNKNLLVFSQIRDRFRNTFKAARNNDTKAQMDCYGIGRSSVIIVLFEDVTIIVTCYKIYWLDS